MSSMAVLLLLIRAGMAIKFPGKCPNVPSSHFFPITSKKDTDLDYIYAVPFSAETPTYLFLDIRTQDKSTYYLTQESSISSGEQNNTINLHYWNVEQRHILIKSVVNKQGDHVLLNSSVLEKKSGGEYLGIGCLPPILEEVRIWIEDKITIIWSCVDLKDNSRDEALLIFHFDPTLHLGIPSKANRWTTTILQQVAKKYVSDALVQTMAVGKEGNIDNREKIGFIPFACLVGKISLVIPIVMFLVFLGVLGVCWYNTN